VEEESRGGGGEARRREGGQPAPPPASLLPVGRRRAARELLSSEDSSDVATKGYAGSISTRFRGEELGNCCGRLTRDEAVPWNLVWFPGFNSKPNPNGGK
jgi:hypothetical protein